MSAFAATLPTVARRNDITLQLSLCMFELLSDPLNFPVFSFICTIAGTLIWFDTIFGVDRLFVFFFSSPLNSGLYQLIIFLPLNMRVKLITNH